MAGEIFSSSRRFRRRMAPVATINVTSLLDIAMVLLISFMVVTPAFQNAIEVNLPEVDSSAVPSQERAVVLSVTFDKSSNASRIYFGEQEVSLDTLNKMLADAKEKKADVSLIVQGDKTVPWNDMAAVLGAIQSSGIERMSLATVPPRP